MSVEMIERAPEPGWLLTEAGAAALERAEAGDRFELTAAGAAAIDG